MNDIAMIVLLLLSIAVFANSIVDHCIAKKDKKNAKNYPVALDSVVVGVDDVDEYTDYLDRVGVDYKVNQEHSVTTDLQYDVVYKIYSKMPGSDCYHHAYFDYTGKFMSQEISSLRS